jgi:hypothetical protein
MHVRETNAVWIIRWPGNRHRGYKIPGVVVNASSDGMNQVPFLYDGGPRL